MVALTTTATFLALESSWWNYPGFEAWKFFNLFVFVGALVYFLRQPVSLALRARREGIRRELIRAQEERDAALAKLAEVEARLSRLDSEVAGIREQAALDSAAEQERIAQSAKEDAEKIRMQAKREIENSGKAAKQELRRFAAEQSVKLAEAFVRHEIKPEDDERLVGQSVGQIGGSRL